jgi:hypothetical protein
MQFEVRLAKSKMADTINKFVCLSTEANPLVDEVETEI